MSYGRSMKIRVKVTLWFTILMSVLAMLFVSVVVLQTEKSLDQDAKDDLLYFMEEGISKQLKLDGYSYENDYSLNFNSKDWGKSYNLAYVNMVVLIEEGVDKGYVVMNDYYKPLSQTKSQIDVDKELNEFLAVGVKEFDNFMEGENVDYEKVRVKDFDGNRYYVMSSKYVIVPGEPSVFVTAIVRVDNYSQVLNTILKSFMLVGPLYILGAAIIGYFIISKAFQPMKEIVNKASEIEDAQNLGIRITLPKHKDEMYELTTTLNAMLDRVEDMFKQQQQFTLDASHELRTPIASLRAQCEYAMEKANSEHEKQQYQQLLMQVNQIAQLVQQLLQISRSESGQIQIQKETFDLNELIVMIIAQEIHVHKDEQTIEYNEKSILLSGDRDLLMRALFNVIDNAYTYGKEKGTIKIVTVENDCDVEIHIQDNGMGIAEEELQNIWKRFFQVDSSRSGNHYGLGLSFVKWIVEAHGGSVFVESELGKGSTFILKIQKR